MTDAATTLPIGQHVRLPEHFDTPVVREGAGLLGKRCKCCFRPPAATLANPAVAAQEAYADFRALAQNIVARMAAQPEPALNQ